MAKKKIENFESLQREQLKQNIANEQEEITKIFDNHKIDYSTSRRRDIKKIKDKVLDALRGKQE